MVDEKKVRRQSGISPKERKDLNESTVRLVKHGQEIGFYHQVSPEMLESMDAEEIIEVIATKSKGGVRYGLSTKIMSLMYMQSTLRDWTDKAGTRELPEYKRLEPLIGISRSTLSKWWERREDIWREDNLIKNEGLNIAMTNFSMVMIKMSTALLSVDFIKMVTSDDPKEMYNFIRLIDVLISKIRLVQNLSTENIAHRHTLSERGVGFVVPEERTEPPKKKDKNDLGEPEK